MYSTTCCSVTLTASIGNTDGAFNTAALILEDGDGNFFNNMIERRTTTGSFTKTLSLADGRYTFHVHAINKNNYVASDSVTFFVGDVTGASSGQRPPGESRHLSLDGMRLVGDRLIVDYTLSDATPVRIDVYDLRGMLVHSSRHKAAPATDGRLVVGMGRALAAGRYLAGIRCGAGALRCAPVVVK